MIQTKMHSVANYILNPSHNINIHLIGCGGNGSFILSRLARIDFALRKLGKPGLNITVYDADVVEEFNIVRQNFQYGDLGEYKALTLTSKINRNFLTRYKSVNTNFNCEKFNLNKDSRANIYITCVDNAQFRIEFDQLFKKINDYQNENDNEPDYRKTFYWLDLGNNKNQGQAILGSTTIQQPNSDQYQDTLRTVIDMFPNLKELDTEEIQGKGCGFADKLQEQDLFINDSLTALSSKILRDILIRGFIDNSGVFLNLKTLRSQAIPIA